MRIEKSKFQSAIFVGLDVHKDTIALAARYYEKGLIVERIFSTKDLNKLRRFLGWRPELKIALSWGPRILLPPGWERQVMLRRHFEVVEEFKKRPPQDLGGCCGCAGCLGALGCHQGT